MTNYTARFCSTNGLATELIQAETPDQALTSAREMGDSDPSALDWYPFEPSDEVEEIEILDSDDARCATWFSNGLTLYLAASDLFDALEYLVEVNAPKPLKPVAATMR